MPTLHSEQTAHSFGFTAVDGSPLTLSSFKGHAVFIVNTASDCGFTPQYKALQSLHARYHERGLIVLGVPCNDFGGQEPGTEPEILAFCRDHFNIEFPLTKKISVKGKEAHPFYLWAAEEFSLIAKPRWNFHKYLVAPDGQLVNWFSTPTSPLSNRVIKAIENELP